MVTQDIKEWWARALLEKRKALHPIFGDRIKVDIDDGVVTLRGKVSSSDEAEEIEREARAVAGVDDVINHLAVERAEAPYHLQTVIAVFPNRESANLAYRAAESWTFQKVDKPKLLGTGGQVRDTLGPRIHAARAPGESIERYLRAVGEGKTLFVERVPEDDARRVIAALEGTPAEEILTLPPEPDSKG